LCCPDFPADTNVTDKNEVNREKGLQMKQKFNSDQLCVFDTIVDSIRNNKRQKIDTILCAIHTKRVSITPRDIKLAHIENETISIC